MTSLENIIKTLSKNRKRLLTEMANALLSRVESVIYEDSDICLPEFAMNFQDRIVLYHAMNDEVMKKKTFEYAFKGAMEAAGGKAHLVNDPTNPGNDVEVDGTKFSLKTEASGSISRGNITISKLMEARWIRDCHSGDEFAESVKARVVTHLNEYERIVMLRAFKINHPRKGFEYHLIEIPRDLLLMCGNLTGQDFSERTKNGSSSADIFNNRWERLWRLSLDGSVEKVTVR